jgi:hypothetical protein
VVLLPLLSGVVYGIFHCQTMVGPIA